MKKFVISLVALAAVSSVAFANSNRSNDLRDADTYTGVNAQALSDSASEVEAFAVKQTRNGSGMTLQDYIDRSQDERTVK